MSKKSNLTVTILIPCYNEEKSIAATIKSCLKQSVAADQIVVVDDGSKDKTRQIVSRFKKIEKVFLPRNTGNKSYVQEAGLLHVNSDIMVTTDADTIIHKDFIKNILPHFKDRNVVAVAGQVRSMKRNMVTASRELEYVLSQDLYKKAQSKIDSIIVIPGAAGAFRTKFFKKRISFDHDTLTEDLDFTYKIHKQGKKVAYEAGAIVYTQDPDTVKGYVNQLRRWYAGGWQNLLKHKDILTQKKGHAFELALTYTEGLTFSFLIVVLPFFDYRFLFIHLAFLAPFAFALAVYAAVRRRRADLLLAFIPYVLLSYVNALVFLEQAIIEGVLRKRQLRWFHPERRAIA